jgi:predicted HTH transcriptional regulator
LHISGGSIDNVSLPHILYSPENTGDTCQFIRDIAEPRQTGKTTNELNRYLNAEKHGLIAVVKNLRDGYATPSHELETKRDAPEISVDAMREAIINAFYHRDYRDPDYVPIAIFKNHVEIRNPYEFLADS